MSLEQNGKSVSELTAARRSVGNLKCFGLGIAFGWLAAPMLLLAVTALIPTSYKYTVIFVEDDSPDFGVSNMRFEGATVEHLFVSRNFVMTRDFSSRKPSGVLTFDLRRDRGQPPEFVTVEIIIREPQRTACTTEIVVRPSVVETRGCMQPIKRLS